MNEVIDGTEPYGDVTCDDGFGEVRHVLWRCPVETAEWFQKAFEEVSTLYVADGHHRTQAAYNVGKARRQKAINSGVTITGEEPFNYFMTLFYPADNLMVLDYNRVLKTLGEMNSEAFLEGIKESYEIEEIPSGESTAV